MTGHERFGWVMFALSGVFFVIIGIRDGDALTLLAAAVWVAGCVAFLTGGRA